MTLSEFQTQRTRIISDMLDNPNEHGIYPTSKCFEELDRLFEKLELPTQQTGDILRAGISAGLQVGSSPNYKIDNREQEIENILNSKWFKGAVQSQPAPVQEGKTKEETIGALMIKIEYWQKQYEFSFQFWEEENNNVFINRGHVEIASFGGERTIQKILERTIKWCEKANPRFKY